MDYILNGAAHGTVASRLMAANFDPAAMRPYIGKDGRHYVDQPVRNSDGSYRTTDQGVQIYQPSVLRNSTATLRRLEWTRLDEVVLKIARLRLGAFQELRAGSEYTIPNGMGTTVLQHQTQSDMSDASLSMDARRVIDRDRPVYDLTNLPLPIASKDWSFSAREIATSRNMNTPLDVTAIEIATRKVLEVVEKLTIGSLGYTYGGGSVYGYTNFPGRITCNCTNPNDGGWTPATTLNEVLNMRLLSQQEAHFGPWMLYNGLGWDEFMDGDFSAAKGTGVTLRQRLLAIKGIQDVRTLDYLSSYDLIMVMLDGSTARAVVGMEMVPLQWEVDGGTEVHGKVMCINVPQLRTDQNGNCGLVHATAI